RHKKMDQPIPLSQKLYLLGIHPEKGGLNSATYHVIGFVLSGALFLELFQQGNIKFEEKKVVFLNDKTSNPIHQVLLEKIKQRPRPLRLATWINRFQISQKYFRKETKQGLVNSRLFNME